MIFLQTSRLYLRNISSKDADIMFDYRNNDLCARYQRGQTQDLPGITALINQHMHDDLSVDAVSLIAVATKGSDELIGEIVVMPNDNTISLGYTISYRHHRKGYAFEALNTLIDHLHTQYPQWEFISFTDPQNTASMALLKKLGYRDMGYLPHRDSQIFGKWTTPETDAEIAAAVKGA